MARTGLGSVKYVFILSILCYNYIYILVFYPSVYIVIILALKILLTCLSIRSTKFTLRQTSVLNLVFGILV